MAEPLVDCLNSGGCLSFDAVECGKVPCNAYAGPMRSFEPPPLEESNVLVHDIELRQDGGSSSEDAI